MMLDNTAAEKLQYLLNKFLEFRKKEKEKLDRNPDLTLGDITTVNLTILNGGVQPNVVPPEFNLAFDIRISINLNHDIFEEMIHRWCVEAGDGIEINYTAKSPYVTPTRIDDSNVFWMTIKSVMVDELYVISCSINNDKCEH